MIELRGVTKQYGKKQNTFVALENITFSVEEGKTVAIVGKSGSGKSTLMHVMSGLDKTTTGSVLVGGQDIVQMKRRAADEFRSRDMSFIFQSFFVQGNETCYNNVSLPLEIAKVPRRQRRARVEQALQAVELLDKKNSKAKDLSGGQKQRLAIARAIVNQPKLLFADEPTGNLDSVTGAVVEKLLFDYARTNRATLVVVTHDQELADKCDVQIHLKDGSIEQIHTVSPVKKPTRKVML